MSSYWTSILNQRLSRRRALSATGGGALGAAFLAACGGDSDSGGSASGIFTPPTDSTKDAVAGGTWISGEPIERNTVDPITVTSSGAIGRFIKHMYSHLLKTGLGTTPESYTKISGDAAESWEIAPDGRQITLKLRPNHVFDPRPPTNGRAMNAGDVKYSWDRFVAVNPASSDVLYSKNPAGPLESMTVTDDRTVVFKLAYPYAPIIDLLSHQQSPMIAPVEMESGSFNPKIEARGSGPWLFDKWETNVQFDLKRNPNWYEKGRPYLDSWSRKFIPEYATGRAQFETGAIWDNFVQRQEDILAMKRDHPQMVLSVDPNLSSNGLINVDRLDFSQRPDSIYADVRVRRAFSMMLDRDQFIEAIFNLSQFAAAGLPVESFWNSHAGAGGAAWLNPKDEKAFGEGAQYFKFNLAEAKKLIAAAGVATTSVEYVMDPANYLKEKEIMAGMVSEGLNITIKRLTMPEVQAMEDTWNEGHNGTFTVTTSGYNEESLFAKSYTPQGNDRLSNKPLPGITDAVIKSRSELDVNKRNDMLKQIQRDLAISMPTIPFPSPPAPRLFTLSWPWVRNYRNFYRGSTSREEVMVWYDASKRTS